MNRIFIPIVAVALLALAQSPAAAQTVESQNLFEMFFTSDTVFGNVITWLLILMSVVVVALIFQHTLLNKANVIIPPESVAAQQDLLDQRKFRDAIAHASEDDSVFGQVMHASLSEAANGYGAMERAIEETADLLGAKRIRSIELLSVFGQVGPMIGLFGTVYGMIAAFDIIVRVGGTPDPADLAGGIRTALVTTFWGLIVGIPAIAAAALIRNKIDALIVETMIQAEMLVGQFSPGARKQKPATAAAGAAAAAGGGDATAAPTAKPAGSSKPAKSEKPREEGGEPPKQS